jgi:hypothetical protein
VDAIIQTQEIIFHFELLVVVVYNYSLPLLWHAVFESLEYLFLLQKKMSQMQ